MLVRVPQECPRSPQRGLNGGRKFIKRDSFSVYSVIHEPRIYYRVEYILLDIMSRVISITIQEEDERDIGEADTVLST